MDEKILEGDNIRHTFSCFPGEMLHVILLDKQGNPCNEGKFKLSPSCGAEDASDISLNTHVPEDLRKRASTVNLTNKTGDLKGN